MFSKACEYAMKAMIHLSAQPAEKRRVGLKEVAYAINGPEAFTAKILQIMVKKNLLLSAKGPNGGFEMVGDGSHISLAQIVDAIDGDSLFTGCALGLESCSESNPCPIHDKFKAIRDHLSGMLQTTSLKEASTGVWDGIKFLKRK